MFFLKKVLTNQFFCVKLKLSKYKIKVGELKMIKEIDCPLCNGGKLKINVPNHCEVVTSGKLSELPFLCVCKTCKRKVKYDIVKSKN